MERLEFYGRVNLMKGGILYADRITTVSPTYREEILGQEQGCGLEGVLQGRRDHLRGILFIDRMATDDKQALRAKLDALQAATKASLIKRAA